jgi:hypothetical protein
VNIVIILSPNINFQKASIFNVGIICLELATLLHPVEFDLYDLSDFHLKDDHLQAYLNTLSELKIYSSKIVIAQLESE